jgi:uncharacterized protein involved in exopolysaccharide biosynthesis
MMGPWERFQRSVLRQAPPVDVDHEGLPLSPSAAAVRSRISVEPMPGGRLVNLNFRAYDPGVAGRAANALADLYIAQRKRLRFSTSSEATGWLEERVADQKKKLDAAELALIQYQDKHGIAAGGSAGDGGALSAAAVGARMERMALESTLAQMWSVGSAQLASFPQISSSGGVQAARSRVGELQSEQARLAETLGDRHPDMVRVRGEIRQAEDKLHAEVRAALRAFEGQVQGARARESALTGDLDHARTKSANASLSS